MEATNQGVSITDRLNNYLLAEESPMPENLETEIEAIDEEGFDDVGELELSDENQEIETDEGVDEEQESLDLSILAQSLGLDVNQLDVTDEGVFVKTKIDGEEGKAKFTDLLKSYQLEGHLNKKDTALAEKLKAAEQRQAEIEQFAQAKLTQLDDTLRLAYNQLQHEASQVNWKELETDDPTEFILQRQKFQDRDAQIRQAFQHMQSERAQLQQQEEQKKQQRISESSQRLLDIIPTWRDSDVAAKEKSAVTQYALENGYTNEEISSIDDYRTVSTLRKAMLYDQLQSKKPDITKKVKKAPKFVKPGQATSKVDRESQDLLAARSRIKKTGGADKSVTDYLMKKGII